MEPNHALMIVPGRRQARRESWLRMVTAWERSGQSGVAFAAEQRIDVRDLYRWRRRIRRQAPVAVRPNLIELPPIAVSAWAAEVATGNGTVRFSPSAPPRWAAQLIRELSPC